MRDLKALVFAKKQQVKEIGFFMTETQLIDFFKEFPDLLFFAKTAGRKSPTLSGGL